MVRCGRQDFYVQIIENINLLLRFEKIAINTPSSEYCSLCIGVKGGGAGFWKATFGAFFP